MKKTLTMLLCASLIFSALAVTAFVEGLTHTVIRGDSMWKIAVKYQVGLSELKAANPRIKNPDLIYPGDVILIPGKDAQTAAYESEVIKLVNEHRRKNGLGELKEDWQLSRVRLSL